MLVEKIKQKLIKRTRKTIGAARSLFALSYRSRLSEDDVFALLLGKTIALVGNAASLSETTYGPAIDSHDIVIRFNTCPVPSSLSHGTRTTIIATSVVIEPQLVRARAAAHVFFMSPRPIYLPGWLVSRPDFFLLPVASHAALMKEVSARPTTGMMVIDLLRRSPSIAIDLYGFDFFASASLSNLRLPKSSPHDFSAERNIVLHLLESDNRFQMNRPANSII